MAARAPLETPAPTPTQNFFLKAAASPRRRCAHSMGAVAANAATTPPAHAATTRRYSCTMTSALLSTHWLALMRWATSRST